MTKARVPWSAIHIEINFLSKCPRIFMMNHQDRNPSAKRPQHHQHLSLRPKKRWHRKPRLHTIWLGWWPLSHCAVPKGAFFQASVHISWCGHPTWLARYGKSLQFSNNSTILMFSEYLRQDPAVATQMWNFLETQWDRRFLIAQIFHIQWILLKTAMQLSRRWSEWLAGYY